MLSGDFFYIKSLQNDGSTINALLEFNATHKIFEGHFPGQPVVPGVCMMQLVKEILETAIDKKIRLKSADNLKFLSLIDPNQTSEILAELKYSIAEDDKIKITATLLNDTVTYFKMSAVFIFAGKE